MSNVKNRALKISWSNSVWFG